MSKFREKAQAVKAAGVAERGNFEPNGVPKRLYQYWLARTNTKRGRRVRHGDQQENFCHFWRVVLFWAPFMWLRRKAKNIVSHPLFVVVVATAAVVGFVVLCLLYGSVWAGVKAAVVGLAVLAAAVAGAIGGISLAVDDPEAVDLPPRRTAKIMALVGLPTAVVAYGLVKFGKWFGNHVVPVLRANGARVAAVTAGLFVVGLLGTIALIEGFVAVLLFLAGLVAFLGLLFGATLVLASIGDYLSGKRHLAKERATTEREAYFEEHGEYPTREPSRVSRFFSGVGDFIILVAQVIRIKKWKICPLLEIDVKTVGHQPITERVWD